jgi:acyl carrier protein phosphodiesterase
VNWLAHSLLSEPTSGFRVGNLLPDLINVSDRARIPAVFHRGVECHRRIDAFTDAHPVVRRSVQRVAPTHRRLAPILVDVFYDHFLSVRWEQYSPVPLADFVREVYASFDEQCAQLPPPVAAALHRMRTENWLECYRDRVGVRLTLERMSRRFRRPVDLVGGAVELERHYDDFGADFDEFFPELRQHIQGDKFNRDNFASVPACP